MNMTDAELMEFGPPPPWASGLAHGTLVPGAQLCTRDGRKCGNAVCFGYAGGQIGARRLTFYMVVTDAGTVMKLSYPEVVELFYPAEWIMESYLPAHQTAIDAHMAELANPPA